MKSPIQMYLMFKMKKVKKVKRVKKNKMRNDLLFFKIINQYSFAETYT